MKKFVSGFICALSLFYFLSFEWFPDFPLPKFVLNEKKCPFCTTEVIANQTVFSGEHVRVLYNFKPMLEGHVLLTPIRHVERFEDLSSDELGEIGILSKKVHKAFVKAYGKEDYVLVLQNGYLGGQTVPHTHFHMIPRGKKDSTIKTKALFWNTVFSEIIGTRNPLSNEEIQIEIQKLRH